METNKLIGHLASVLGDNFNLSLTDVEEADSEADKEIIYGLICLHDDLAFYKKRSELLLENFKNTLFSSAAITITNSKGVIRNVNELMVKLSLYPKAELIGSRHDILDSKEEQNEDYQSLLLDITASKTWRGEVKSMKKNGATFWLDTHIFPIKNTEGNIYEYWTVSTDISKRKNIELEIIETDPSIKGGSATARTKPAVLSTGLTVQVPEHISTGDRIKVNVEERKFMGRAESIKA